MVLSNANIRKVNLKLFIRYDGEVFFEFELSPQDLSKLHQVGWSLLNDQGKIVFNIVE